MNNFTAARNSGDVRVPLVVDVDGTLIRTDLLHEAALQFVARYPLQAWRLPLWTLQGKARLKTALAERSDPQVDLVPLRDETVMLIRDAQAQGRPVYLASASERRYVEALGTRVGGIEGVFATDATVNLAGRDKAGVLNDAFGHGQYDYVGDTHVDFHVWEAARGVHAVSRSGGFARKVSRAFPHAEFVAHPRTDPRAYLRAMRPHQWAKNLLLFVGPIAAHALSAESIAATVLAFLCFCFAASSAYILNDLLDLPGDREHPRKRRRPFAAGEVPIPHGIALCAVLMGLALAGSLLLPGRFILVLAAYVATTLAYSFVLKRRVLIDVITLGGLYTLRVFAGLAALGLAASPWLLMFSLFQFLSLAVVKRCSELVVRREEGKTGTAGRGYHVEDLGVLMPIATAAAYGAVLVITLYLSSPEVVALYHNPNRLWLVTPLLLYWTSRVLILSNRGEMHDDPVVFALRDRVSWVVGVLIALVVATAI